MKQLDQKGVVSLLITVIIGLLLITITVSMVILSIGEQRQAQDTDQSTKAFYTAQAGEEFMLYNLRDKIANNDFTDVNADCSSAGLKYSFPAPAGTITCQRILFSDNNQTGSLGRDISDEVSAGTGATYDKVNIAWGAVADGPIGGTCTDSGTRTGPAPLEVVIVQYDAASITNANVNSRTVLLCPVASGAAPIIRLDDATKGTVLVPCTGVAGGYQCGFSFTRLAADGNSYLLRLRPRFIGTNYRVDFSNGGTTVDVPSGYATVDVTAKTGDVYRRVARRVKLRNGLASGLDYVLFSDNDICKNFTVIGGSGLAAGSTCQ